MTTALDLLNSSTAPVDYIMIDPVNRTVAVNELESTFGVYLDRNVERKHFMIPRYIDDNIDLSTCRFYVNYVSVGGNPGQYVCEDVSLYDDETVTFSWLLSGNVFDRNTDGEVEFAIQASNTNNESVFNTRPAKGIVYKTIDAGERIEELYPDAYNQGQNKVWSDFWEEYQSPIYDETEIPGGRTTYSYAFYGSGWTDQTFKPKYDLHLLDADYMFANSKITNLAKILNDQGIRLYIYDSSNINYIFKNSTITHLPVIDLTSISSFEREGVSNLFSEARDIVSIELIKIKTDGSQGIMSLAPMHNLMDINVEGKAGSSVYCQTCTNLSHESLINIFNALLDLTGTGDSATIYIGSENQSKLTAEELLIPGNKGWVVK